jgi:outer membrane biosynthesis protein TonB
VRRAYIYSGVLHLGVIAAAFYGLPEIFDRKPLEDVVLPVEIVSLQDASPKPEPAKEPPKPPPPPPEPPRAATPPPPPPAPPEPVKAPEPPPPLPKPEPVKQPEPQQVQRPAPPAPKPKPAPPPDQLASLLKDLKQEKAKVESQQPKQVTLQPPQPATTSPAPQVASIDQRRDAAQLARMVSDQISPCWNLPAGARDARDMRVGIRITLNPDGSLRGLPAMQDQSRMGSDGVFRAFGESAIRALQQCSPLKLPSDKYALWQDMIVNFDPRDLAR